MQQEIVFCESIFKTIQSYFEKEEIWDAYTYNKNLSNVKIITSKKNRKTFEVCLNKRKGFFYLFKNHLYGDKLFFKHLSELKSFNPNSRINVLLNLAFMTEDKIIHTELKEIKSELVGDDSVEILSMRNFNSPPAKSKFISSSRSIVSKKGEMLDFTKIFKPYLRATNQIEIHDRYIRKKDKGFLNLIRILDLCVSLENCKIYTLNFPNDSSNKFDMTIEDLKTELKAKYSFNCQILPAIKHRRLIVTDEFEIKIDPGLDFVNKEYICQRNDVDIQINKIM